MKQIIKNFLFKKRFKILKSKKGFSLLEVLVAVGIIAIISAIAVPQFTGNREQAAKVAGETSVLNVQKAFQNCIVLKPFSQCNTLALLNITCPDCNSEEDTADGRFCAHIEKDVGSDQFTACVSIEGSDINKSYGGSLMSGVDVCVETHASPLPVKAKHIQSPLKNCSVPTDCQPNTPLSGVTYDCEAFTQTGKCDTDAECT